MMATSANPPTSFGLQHSSPLETLVRRTSSRRKPPSINPQFTYPAGRQPSAQKLGTPPREPHLAPASPLLHSHFAAGSVATASSRDDNSYLDFSGDSAGPHDAEYYFDDAESIYSTNTLPAAPALRDSWDSVRPHPDSYVANRSAQPDPYMAYKDPYAVPPDTSAYEPVPMVVVSSPLPDPSSTAGRAPIVGKAPVLRPGTSNFSRPVRPLVSNEDMERRKLIVLQRNARQGQSPPPSSPLPSAPQSYYSSTPTQQSQPDNYNDPPRSPSPTSTIHASPSDPYLSARPETVHLHRKPPSIRPGSPASSLYSTYSYYQLDTNSPSPTGSSHFTPDMRSTSTSPQPKVTFKDPSPSPGLMKTSPNDPSTPHDYLQLGITHHEADRLTESAACFEKSATLQGGCGVGMLMWGLSLRHGWGCKKDEKSAFSWLRKAAELAVSDLERMGAHADTKEGIKGELVLAIYEVGQCFFHGWGVKQDQKMGVSYYTTAARLGDPDAQSDLGFCLANGKGCKKDRKEAAKWYRKAVAQGLSEVGLAWIHKEKFQ